MNTLEFFQAILPAEGVEVLWGLLPHPSARD